MADGNNELALGSDNAVATQAPTGDQRMAMLKEALVNPDVDPAKALAMADLIFKVEDRELRAQFNRDKVAAINKMPQIYQSGVGHHNIKYAKFEDLHRRIRPILDEHHLTLRFDIDSNQQGNVAVTPILEHENGQNERGGTMIAPPDNGGKKTPVQAVASTASYLKRHTMKAMLNIIEGGEDDDGMGGGTPEDRLEPHQRQLIDDGRSAAMNGSDAYMQWFQGLEAAQKGWLAFEPYHAQNKQAAAAADNQ